MTTKVEKLGLLVASAETLFETLLDGVARWDGDVGNWRIIVTDEDCINRIRNWLENQDE